MRKRAAHVIAWGAAAGSALALLAVEFAGGLASDGAQAGGLPSWAPWGVTGALVLLAGLLQLSARRPRNGAADGVAPDSADVDAELLLRLHTQGLVAAYTPSLAHDGNNALLEMRFQLAELRRLHDADGATRSLADGMDSSVTTLEELIRRARGIEGGEGALRLGTTHPLDLAALVRHTLAGLRTHLRSRACVVLESLPDGLAARGNVRDLEQMIFSLLLHGVSRAGDGGNVTVELATENGRAQLIVHDDGAAPDPAELRLSKRPLHGSHSDPDGLKLWASDWHLRAHGGELSLEISPFGGLLRRALLPLPGAQPEVSVLDHGEDVSSRDQRDEEPRVRS